jgi:hypothetical protein
LKSERCLGNPEKKRRAEKMDPSFCLTSAPLRLCVSLFLWINQVPYNFERASVSPCLRGELLPTLCPRFKSRQPAQRRFFLRMERPFSRPVAVEDFVQPAGASCDDHFSRDGRAGLLEQFDAGSTGLGQ